jgi:hypothetical protein
VLQVEPELVLEPDEPAALRVRLPPDPAAGAAIAPPPSARRGRDHGLLSAFVALANGSDRDVLRFAKRFGALDLCKHGLPLGHRAGDLIVQAGLRLRLRSPDKRRPVHPNAILKSRLNRPPCGERLLKQPAELYRGYAAQMRAVLGLAAAVHRREAGRPEDWAILRPERDRATRPAVSIARDTVEQEVSRWLLWGRAQLQFRWLWPNDTRVELTGAGLWGALARQLAFAVAKVDGFAVCAGCGSVFVPKRQPISGRRAWCGNAECRRARGRLYTQKHRAKRRRSGE